MQQNHVRVATLSVIVSFLFQFIPLPDVWALGSGGFSNQVVGLRSLGKGNSTTAQPEDASTVYMNPAAMPFLDGMQTEEGVTFEILQFEHKAPNGNETQGEKSIISVPHAFMTTGNALTDRFSIGFGVTAPFGLMTEWDQDTFAKFAATQTELVVSDYNPVIAYKVTDNLAIAGGAIIYDSYVSLKKMVNVTKMNSSLGEGSPTGNQTGAQQIKGDDSVWGYNLALYYEPTVNHHLGATYRGPSTLEYDGHYRVTGLTSTAAAVFGGSAYQTKTTSKMTLPQSMELGYSYTPDSKKWVWELDGAWTGWNSIERTRFDFPDETNATRLAVLNTDNPFGRDWRSTVSAGTGFEYRAKDWLKLRTGYYFYQTPVPGDHLEPSLPDSDRHAFTGGLGFEKGNFRADAAYALVIAEKRRIDNTVANASDSSAIDGRVSSIDGEYSGLHHLFGINLSWRF